MSEGNYYLAFNDEDKNNCVKCQILLLDGGYENFTIPRKSSGQFLLDLVLDALQLNEREYFGLQYKDSHPSSGKFNRWLNSAKTIKKQLIGTPPFNLQFKIRFFPSNTNQIREDYTKYLLYLQLKKELYEDRLCCSKDMAAILASYSLQAELGDYKPNQPNYISKFKFIKNQTADFENEVINLHELRKSMSSRDAESEFLTFCSRLSYYGVDVFNALTSDKTIVQIGPSSLGFNVFQNKKRIHLLLWTNIFKISFKKKRITIQVKSINSVISSDNPSESQTSSLHSSTSSTKSPAVSSTIQVPIRFCYTLSSFPVCKNLWQNCIDYHVFYRLRTALAATANNNSNCSINNKTRFSSTHTRRSSLLNVLSKPNIPNILYGNAHSSTISRKSLPFQSDNNAAAKRSNTVSERSQNHYLKDDILPLNASCTPDIKHSSNNFLNNSNRRYIKRTIDQNAKDKYVNRMEEPLSISKDQGYSKSYSSLATTRPHPYSALARFDSDHDNDYEYDDNEEIRDSDFLFSDHDDDDDDEEQESCSINDYDNCRKQTPNKSMNSSTFTNYMMKDKHKNPVTPNQLKQKTLQQPFDRFKAMNKSMDESVEFCSVRQKQSNNSLESLIDKSRSLSIKSGRILNHNKEQKSMANNQDLLMIVLLYPDKEGRYGFTIKPNQQPLCINNIAKDSPADTCYPRLSVGDQLVAISGIDVSDFTHEEAITMIRRCADSDNEELKLTIRPANYMVDCVPHQYIDNNNKTVSDNHQSPDLNSEKIIKQSSFNCSTIGRKKSLMLSQEILNSTYNSNPSIINTALLQKSMNILENDLDSGEVYKQFESVYRSKPGMTMLFAKKSENFARNRYRDISPYDQTRVLLKGSKKNDYINASNVNMQLNEKGLVNRYIACQGPLAQTLDHFWQMCWEQNTRLIVMLTSVTEGGRPKCHVYWPPLYETLEFAIDLTPSSSSTLQVSCLSEEHRYLHESATTAVIIRELSVYLSSSGEQRRIRHLQYASWPDHGVPMLHDEFLVFVSLVRSYRSSYQMEPMIVHCSAGIGRTGVLITMESAMCLMEAGKSIDVKEILRQMRDQRASMIQTPAQFVFVCEAIFKYYKESTKYCDIR